MSSHAAFHLPLASLAVMLALAIVSAHPLAD